MCLLLPGNLKIIAFLLKKLVFFKNAKKLPLKNKNKLKRQTKSITSKTLSTLFSFFLSPAVPKLPKQLMAQFFPLCPIFLHLKKLWIDSSMVGIHTCRICYSYLLSMAAMSVVRRFLSGGSFVDIFRRISCCRVFRFVG